DHPVPFGRRQFLAGRAKHAPARLIDTMRWAGVKQRFYVCFFDPLAGLKEADLLGVVIALYPGNAEYVRIVTTAVFIASLLTKPRVLQPRQILFFVRVRCHDYIGELGEFVIALGLCRRCVVLEEGDDGHWSIPSTRINIPSDIAISTTAVVDAFPFVGFSLK